MSRYEWEEGTIKLPSTEAKNVRDAVRAAAEAHSTHLYEEAQKFWHSLPPKGKNNGEYYPQFANQFLQSGALNGSTRGFRDDLGDLLLHVCLPYNTKKPRRCKQEDVKNLVGKITGANPQFNCGEAHLSFDGRAVTWRVDENNHAREYARDHPIAEAFFRALDRVKWTRGSGGQIVGNDEYNRESTHAGGGGNYVVDEYGPNIKRYTQDRIRGRGWVF